MKKRDKIIYPLSFIILLASFAVIRFALFETHGMKELPLILFSPCLIVLIICLASGATVSSLMTAISYPLGFAAGLFFQTDSVDAGGGAANDLWIIWTVVSAAVIAVSVITEAIIKKSINNNQ